jgi:hypothetical protein
MCSTLYRQFCNVFILHSSKNEDRNPRSCPKEPSERLHPAAVRQRKVHQDCSDTVCIVTFSRHFLCQHFKAGGAVSDPQHSERPITRMDQGISNRTGIDSIILNKKYVLQCSILRGTVHLTKSTQDFA